MREGWCNYRSIPVVAARDLLLQPSVSSAARALRDCVRVPYRDLLPPYCIARYVPDGIRHSMSIAIIHASKTLLGRRTWRQLGSAIVGIL